MNLCRKEKVTIIEGISTEVSKANLVVIAEYRGLDVPSFTLLRKLARNSNVYLRVVKNSLAIRAFRGTTFESLSDQFVGTLVYGISVDPLASAKVFVNFAKDNTNLIVKAGALPNQLLNANDVKNLALIPSYEELISKLLRTIQAPITQFIGTLDAIPTKLVRSLLLICNEKTSCGSLNK